MSILPARIQIHRHRRRCHSSRRHSPKVRESVRPVEAAGSEQVVVVSHRRRIHVERHEPRRARIAPVAAVCTPSGAGHGVEVPAVEVAMHGHAVAVDHLVGVGQVLLLLLGDGGGVLIAAVVGREYHLAIQLGHYTVLLLHDERVVRGLEAGWEGRGVLADVVGRCVMLLVHAIVGNLLLHVLWVMLERLRHLLLLMLLLLQLCLLARGCCIAPFLGVVAGLTSLAAICLRVLLLPRLACLLLRLRICSGSTWWAEFGEDDFIAPSFTPYGSVSFRSAGCRKRRTKHELRSSSDDPRSHRKTAFVNRRTRPDIEPTTFGT